MNNAILAKRLRNFLNQERITAYDLESVLCLCESAIRNRRYGKTQLRITELAKIKKAYPNLNLDHFLMGGDYD